MPNSRGEMWWSIALWTVVLGGGLVYSVVTAPGESEQIERAISEAQAKQRSLRAETVRAIGECQATVIEYKELADVCRETLRITLDLNRSMYDSLQSRIEKLKARREALPTGR